MQFDETKPRVTENKESSKFRTLGKGWLAQWLDLLLRGSIKSAGDNTLNHCALY